MGTLAGGLLAAPLAAEAQQPARAATIGVLASAEFTEAVRGATRDGLRDQGYIEGQNIVIEWRSAEARSDRAAAPSTHGTMSTGTSWRCSARYVSEAKKPSFPARSIRGLAGSGQTCICEGLSDGFRGPLAEYRFGWPVPWADHGSTIREDDGVRSLSDQLCPQCPRVTHSITWSARCSSDGGIVSPRALAVLRLIPNSNLVACSTGMPAGLAPLRILSTKTAARRYISRKSTP